MVTKDVRRDISIPSVPPASTYRAGHYAGFHPEDQPYESSMIAVQHPVEAEVEQRNRVQPEPERIVLPSVSEALALRKQRERDVEKQTRANRLARMHARVRIPARVGLSASKKPLFSVRVISLGLTLSCIVFLLAASIIAFVLIGKHRTEATAIVQAAPDAVRAGDVFTLMGSGFTVGDVMTFTYDGSVPILNEGGQPINIHINRSGGFSVDISVSDRWSVGTHTIDALDTTAGMDASTQITVLTSSLEPPVLQLAQTHLQFPDAPAGVVSSQFVVLKNSGGSKLIWRARSDQPWLTFLPESDTFAGAERVQIIVNRGGLAAQAYTGHVLFSQQDGHVPPSELTVQMLVKPAQASLSISTTNLTYLARSPRNPADQFITLRNDSKNTLSWASSVSINEGVPWIMLNPAYGQLRPGERRAIAVSIQAQSLTPGIYQGVINFTGGADAQVHVGLKVLAAERTTVSEPAAGNSGGGNLPLPLPVLPGLSPTALAVTPAPVPAPTISINATTMHFSTVQGQNPPAQNVTLTNTGNAVLQWNAAMSGSGIFSVTPANGNLAAGASVQLIVSASAANAGPGTLTATMTIAGASLPAQKIAVDITINSAQPALSVSPAAITCSNASTTDASQQFSITNNGSGTAHWGLQRASASTDTSWLSFDLSSGELAPGESTTISVHCDGSGLNAGTITSELDVSDSDAGKVIKAVPVTFTVN